MAFESLQKNRKQIFIVALIIISLLVWSRNIYLIIQGVFNNDEEVFDATIRNNININLKSNFPADTVKFIYKATSRDPFEHQLFPKQPKHKLKLERKSQLDISKQKRIPPRFYYTGIFQDDSGELGILENSEGETFFISDTSVIENVQILKMYPDSIVCQFEKQVYSIPLHKYAN